MAVTAEKGDQITNNEADPVVLEDTASLHGRKRIAFFSHTQVAAGDANSTVEVVKLPAGKVRVMFQESRIEHNWSIALVDMNVGWQAYTDNTGATVAADANGIDAAIDVDAAAIFTPGSAIAAGAGKTKIFNSESGVTLELQAVAAGLAIGDVAQGYFTYVVA